MSSPASTARPALLVVRSGDTSWEHLRAEPANGEWRIIDSRPSGMFVDGLRQTSMAITKQEDCPVGDPRPRGKP